MTQFIVRNLEESVKEGLKRRARKHGRSMEAEVRDILRASIADTGEVQPLGSRISKRFKQIGLDKPIEELRGQAANPAILRE